MGHGVFATNVSLNDISSFCHCIANGCGSSGTTAKLRKIRLFRKFADLKQSDLPEIWLLKSHIQLLLIVI
jgi:hypothetical protein